MIAGLDLQLIGGGRPLPHRAVIGLDQPYHWAGLQNTYFTFFEFATFFRFLSLDLRFFLKKRTVNWQTLNRS